VLHIKGASHGEYEQIDGPLIIDELLCSLVGTRMDVEIVDQQTRDIYGAATAIERYYCRFGLNESYVSQLAGAGLVVAGSDAADGSTRILRYLDSPFGFLTLFVPQAASSMDHPHPLVTGLVAAAMSPSRDLVGR
jgi:CTP synthase (UTP-ammonia lyase)